MRSVLGRVMRRLVVVVVFAVAACSGQPGDDIDPVVGTPSTKPVVPLSMAQATKAALLVRDFPKGWDGGVAADPKPTPGYRGEYDAPECLAFRHPTDLLGTPTTAVRGQYFIREKFSSVTELVWSWPTRLDSFNRAVPSDAAFAQLLTKAIARLDAVPKDR
ncbi:hypothetical protein [Kribbella solani]|uniref:hypothetical protein n=1 Tax=Kribbella solani TaxID=236067 RepID=UPI0029B2B290|nr:hypothetical protein [Kribbella solani]MDX2971780.1 hypothetical protein [Kribbella solani]